MSRGIPFEFRQVAASGEATADEVRVTGGVLAAAAVGLLAVARIALNAPLGESPVGIQGIHAIAGAAAVLVSAIVAVAVGAVADAETPLVGLIAAGPFAALEFAAPAAGVPAAGVLPVAALLVVAPSLFEDGWWTAKRAPFGALLVGGVALSLGAAAGPLGPGTRSLGTAVALAALAVAPLAVGATRPALFVGAVAGVAVAVGATVAPFVAGAVFLAVGAAVDPSIVLAVAGVGGGVAVTAEGVYRRRAPLASGGLLLLAAGVPATVPRALAVILGTHLVLVATGPRSGGGRV